MAIVLAGVAIGLVKAEDAGPGVAGVGEDVAHVVEEDEADGVAEPGQAWAGGRRSSVLLTSAPAPPMGKPVSGSRGPAPLKEKPRSEVGPPE